MAKLLIENGANVDLQTANGLTPLHYIAANNGNSRFAETLIKHGATVDARDQNLVTPLQLAVFNGMNSKLCMTYDANKIEHNSWIFLFCVKFR